MAEVPPGKEPKHEDHWVNYVDYNKTLRTWFVSFGIGGPVLLLLNPSLLQALKAAERAGWVVSLFVLGCALQVVTALINKTVSWYMYCGEREEATRGSWWYGRCSTVSEWYWLDLAFDVLTFLAFAGAVVLLVDINLSDLAPTRSPQMPQ